MHTVPSLRASRALPNQLLLASLPHHESLLLRDRSRQTTKFTITGPLVEALLGVPAGVLPTPHLMHDTDRASIATLLYLYQPFSLLGQTCKLIHVGDVLVWGGC